MNGRQQTKLFLIIFGIVVTVIALHKSYLMPWQIPLFNTRKAVIKYMKNTHPNYHIVEEEVKYSFTTGGGFFPQPDTITPRAIIVFNEDGFEYTVVAWDGKVTDDTYARSKLNYEVKNL